MASVRQIAQRVGVSAATVSRALNNHPNVDPETRRKVLEAASLNGYVPPLPRTQSIVVGLVYPADAVRPDYGAFESALMSGMMRALDERRGDLKIVSLARDKTSQETYTQFFARKGLRGVILRSFEESRDVCQAIAREGFPAVVAADRFEDPAVNYICCESRDDSRRAVQHLIDLGHRRIALGMHAIRDTDHLDRKAGYEQAMLENGLAIDPSYDIEILGSMEGGAGLITRLMSLPVPPTAVFLTDPLATVGALRRCLELGIRVPTDLSIVGFDDSDIRRHTYPMFSAVCQDAEMLGFESARWLCRVLTDPDTENGRSFRITRQTRLEINQSTGRPTDDPFRVLPDGTRTTVLAEDIPVVTVRRRTS